MNTFYKFLGITAKINESCSRKSVNGIQLNWMIIFLSLGFLFLSLFFLVAPFLPAHRADFRTSGRDVALTIVLLTASLPIAILFLTTWFLRYVVFRPSLLSSSISIPIGHDLLPNERPMATGRFAFNEKISKNFIGMSASLNIENDVLYTDAHVDASSRFGLHTRELKGIWAISVPKGSVQNVETGTQYYGTKRWHAVRTKYRSEKGIRKFLLGFSDEEARNRMAALLLSYR